MQPISQNISLYPKKYNLGFKKSENKNNLISDKLESKDSFEKKIIEQNERMIIINGVQTIAFIALAFLISMKISRDLFIKKLSNKSMPAVIRDFESLKNNKKIPTLETCKSINKDLRALLERQISYNKAGKDLITESGEPKTANRLLLYGPPGVGKSYFAKIYAKSMDAEYKEILYSDFNSMWVGEGNDNFKQVFEATLDEAKKNPNKKFVVTFNEVDAIVVPSDKISNHTKGTHWVSKLEERSIFLDYMELLREEAPNVTVIGTTNLSPLNNGLDRAAMSRFQNLIEVPYPDKDCLYEALKMNLDKINNKETFFKNNDTELRKLADKMAERKYSFRNLEFVVNEAKNYHLDEKLKNKNTEFSVNYLKKAQDNLKISDGELEKTK